MKYFAAIVIIIILICAYIYFNRTDPYSNYLEGMWKGDDGFCEKSGATSMLLYIGEYDGKLSNSYLIINDNICNQQVTITYKPLAAKPVRHIDAKFSFTDPVDIPEKLTLTIDIAAGSLKIHDKTKLYGLFYKDFATTNLTKNAGSRDADQLTLK